MIVQDDMGRDLYHDNIAVVSPVPPLVNWNVAFTNAYEMLDFSLEKALEVSDYKKDSVVPVFWGNINGHWVGTIGMMRVAGDDVRFSYLGYDGDHDFRVGFEEEIKQRGFVSQWEQERVRYYGRNPQLFNNRAAFVSFQGVKTKNRRELLNTMVSRLFR